VHYVRTLGLFLSFFLGTLCTYTLIVYSELVTFPFINFICLICVLQSQTTTICVLLSRLILYGACCYLMTNSISTLVDLWNTKRERGTLECMFLFPPQKDSGCNEGFIILQLPSPRTSYSPCVMKGKTVV
jgi:hypothetical protein